MGGKQPEPVRTALLSMGKQVGGSEVQQLLFHSL